MKQELLEKDRLIAAQQERIEELAQALESFRAEVAETTELRRQLAVARSRPGKVLWELLRHRVLSYLSTKTPPFSAGSAAAFARSAQKRDPKRSLGTALESTAPKAPLPTRRRPAAILDAKKKTILIVSHEASRTGAPVLALNIIRRFSTRYNVISLILGGGDLTDHFRRASASLYEADRIHMTERELGGVIRDIASQHSLMFAVVNSLESEWR